jgi:hypothetical protein
MGRGGLRAAGMLASLDAAPREVLNYSPIDERPTRNPAFDAQRSAANTNDLRGKLLRIRVRANGGYDIPPGNLFPRGTPKTRPEIYRTGPFRFDINPKTGDVYMADYSPDAREADPGEPFQFGQQVTWTVTVVDDTPVDCADVKVAYVLGHESHGHPLSSASGCSGTFTTSAAGHEGLPNIRAVFAASYTDSPPEGAPALTGTDEVVLEPNP